MTTAIFNGATRIIDNFSDRNSLIFMPIQVNREVHDGV